MPNLAETNKERRVLTNQGRRVLTNKGRRVLTCSLLRGYSVFNRLHWYSLCFVFLSFHQNRIKLDRFKQKMCAWPIGRITKPSRGFFPFEMFAFRHSCRVHNNCTWCAVVVAKVGSKGRKTLKKFNPSKRRETASLLKPFCEERGLKKTWEKARTCHSASFFTCDSD